MPLHGRQLPRLVAGLVATILTLAVGAASAHAVAINDCTRARVAEAIAVGGTYEFNCDGVINMGATLTVGTTVSFDATGRDVTFRGQFPAVDPSTGQTGTWDGRVLRVGATGSLTLRGVNVEDGIFSTSTAPGGAHGTTGTAGAAGGGPGGDAPADARPGGAATEARGGCLLVEAGGRLVLRSLAVRRCDAVSGAAGAPGWPARAGTGGAGTGGASGTNGSDGQPGGPGGPAGASAHAVPGAAGAHGRGGAIYSAGTLDIRDVQFVDNAVRGGRGGTGGEGGLGGTGGRGGNGGHPSGSGAVGGNGGTPGAPSPAKPGGRGGNGGNGQGGAIYAVGETSIVNAHFARNGAYGAIPGPGGRGGHGSGAALGLPGRIQIIGGAGDAACDIPDDNRSYRQCGQWTPNHALPGADGGLGGNGGHGQGGAIFFEGAKPPPVNTTNDANHVHGGDNNAALCAIPFNSSGCSMGGVGGTFLTGRCGPNAPWPACVRAPDGARGFVGEVGTASDPDVASDQFDGLSVTINYDGDDVPGSRLPLDEEIDATVKVSAAAGAPGAITDIVFPEGKTLFESENDLLRFSGTDPPAQPFTLQPGASRTFEVKVTGIERGTTAMRSAVTGKDPLGRTAEAGAREVVRVGEDIKVGIAVDPEELELEVDEATGKPEKKPVTITVDLENVAGEDLTDVVLDLRTTIKTLVGRNPTAPYPIQITALKNEGAGPDTPITNEQARAYEIGALADQAKKKLVFLADAADKAVVELRADATGKAAGPRTVVGTKRTEIRIGQPRLLSITAGPQWPTTLQEPQTHLRYDPVIENISPDESVLVRVGTGQVGAITGDPLVDDFAESCTPGVLKLLEPGERLLLGSVFTTADGRGTRGTVKIEVEGWTHPDTADEAPVAPSQMTFVDGAGERTVSVNQAVTFPQYSVPELGWIFTRNFTGGLIAELGSFANLGYNLLPHRLAFHGWNAMRYAWEHATPEDLEALRQQASAIIDKLARLTTAQGQVKVAEAIDQVFVPTFESWYEGDIGTLVQKFGTVAGALSADAVLSGGAKVVGCLLVETVAGRAIARAATAQATTLAARVAASGRRGLQAADELSFRLARDLYGMDRVLDGRLADYAFKNKLVIAMRDRSPGSIARLAEGLLPKIEKVKAKNVNTIDTTYLGFPDEHLDKAMVKEMKPWAQVEQDLQSFNLSQSEIDEIRTRWEVRNEEWTGKVREELEGFRDAGSIPVPTGQWGVNPIDNGYKGAENVWTRTGFRMPEPTTKDGLKAYLPEVEGTGKRGRGFWALTGDMDGIAILDANGNVITDPERRKAIWKDLARMGFQHPESLTWENAAGRAKYLFDFDYGANRNAEALLAYMPDGKRRAVYFDSRKSVWDQQNGELKDGFIALHGVDTNLTERVVGHVPYDGPSVLNGNAIDDAAVTVSPAGPDGGSFDNAPSTPTVVRNPDGSYSESTGGSSRSTRSATPRAEAGGWIPWTPTPGQPVVTKVQSGVSEDTEAGATSLPVFALEAFELLPGAKWFTPGGTIVIDLHGPNEERVVVSAVGARTLTTTLTRDHRAGERVVEIAVPPVTPGAGAAPILPPTSKPGPGSAPKGTAPTPARRTPLLSGAKLAKASFARGKGTKLSFSLDRAATVTATLTRSAKGRRKGKACSVKARSGRRCTAQVKAGTVRIVGKAGRTTVTFGKRLKRGRYVAKLTAGGNTVTLRFTVR